MFTSIVSKTDLFPNLRYPGYTPYFQHQTLIESKGWGLKILYNLRIIKKKKTAKV